MPGTGKKLFLLGASFGLIGVVLAQAPKPPTDTFLLLRDTPDSYSGQAGKAVIVNPGATGLIFGTATGGSVSDTAYGAGWNGSTTVAPSQNALYDWAHTFDTNDNGTPNKLDLIGISGPGVSIVGVNNTGIVSIATPGTDYESLLTFADSLNRTGSSINLDGDNPTPGASKYYGTDGTSAKGWFALPAAGGVTSFNTRTGAVVPATNDYAFSQISGIATTAQGAVLTGGTTDQVLAKNSNTNYDLKWTTLSAGGNVSNSGTPTANQLPIWVSATTIKGVTGLTGGTSTQVLKKNSATDYDWAWAADATAGGATWGSITGTLSSQTDLQTALDAKLATAGDLSPLFTTTEATQNVAFSLTSAAATTVFGRAAGTSGAPTYSSAPQFLKIGNLTTNGFVKTGSSDGTLSVDTSTYLTSTSISDTAYAGTWDTVTTIAPSKNAVYDKIETLQPLDTDLTAIAGISGVQGDVIYHNGTSWTRLGAGTDGNQLTTHSTSANPTWDSPGAVVTGGAPVVYLQTAVVAPSAGTTSPYPTLKMAGLNQTITPAGTGKVVITISGYLANDTAGGGTVVRAYYGTGAAPTNGAAVTGTALGSIAARSGTGWTANESAPFSVTGIVSVTAGTPIWVDAAFAAAAAGGGTANFSAAITAVEVPAGSVEDTAFAATWDTVTGIAPSKNAVYDRFHLIDTDDDGKVNVLDTVAGLVKTDASGVVSNAVAGTDYQAAGAYLTANQPISLTGDVTGGPAATSIATTIGANKVTLGMMATMATDSILGRATAATGNVEVLAALPFAYTGDVTRPVDSNVTTLAAGNAGNLNSGTLLAARMPALTGDVTTTVGTVATTYNNAVPTAKAGLPTGGTANQVLSKIDGTNYNTQWVTPGGGGNVSNSGTPTVDQLGIWVTATTIKGVTALPAVNFPALTGDVTTTAGALATTIGANKVTLPMMATMATDSILGRATTATGNVEVLASLPFAWSGGDITRAADSNTETINANAVTTAKILDANVTYAKIQNVSATSRFLGRITAAAGVVEELTAANAKTILALTATDVGLGNVTNNAQLVTAGDLSPLFTTTETAGNVAFSLTNAAAGTVFANNTTGSAAPAFVTNPRITAIANLTSDGFVKTGGGIGTLSVDTNTYLTTASAASTYQPLDTDLTTLAAISGVRGDVLFYGASGWARLGVGTSGQQLTTGGAGADPTWAAAGGGGGSGDVVGPASATDNAVARFDATTGKLIQNSAVTIDDTTGLIRVPDAGGLVFTGADTGMYAPYGGAYLMLKASGTDLMLFQGSSAIRIHGSSPLGWTASDAGGTVDTALFRNAAGVVEVNNGTAGQYRDLKARQVNIMGSATGIIQQSSNGMLFYGNGTTQDLVIDAARISMRSGQPLVWVSSPLDALGGTGDVSLYRSAAGELTVGTGGASGTGNLKVNNLTVSGTCTGCGGGGGSGDVVGPASATDNAIARFDTTTGKLIQDSAVSVADTTGLMSWGGDTGIGRNAGGVLEVNNGTAGTYRDIKVDEVDAVTGYKVNGTATGSDYFNSSVSDQSLTTSDAYITGSSVVVPAGAFKAKGQYRCVFDSSKTAGTGAIVITLRVGTAGTTADTSRITFTFGSGTSVSDGAVFDIIVNWRTVGSGTSAVVAGSCRAQHNLATTGFFNNAAAYVLLGTPSGGFNSSADTTIGLSFNGGTAFSGLIRTVQATLLQ